MKKLFFLPALAAMMFSSCSSDEPTVDNPTGKDGESYMAINIKNVGQGSRAAEVGDPEFEAGLDKEGNITKENLYFLFFDGNGNAFPLAYANVNGTVSTNMVKPSEIAWDKTDGDDKTLTGVLVLGKAVGEGYIGKKPSTVICVANPNAGVMADLANKNLTTVLATVTNVPADVNTTWYGNNAKFLMTNSVYANADANATSLVQEVDVTGCIKDTPDEAKNNPAVIYIERVAAKVRATYTPTMDIQKRVKKEDGTTEVVTGEEATFLLDNEEVTFTAAINGWQLYNTAVQANAFKNLNLTTANAFTWKWNDVARHRSYWAVSNQGATLEDNTWDIYDAASFTNQSFAAATPDANIAYCYENTGFTGVEANDRTPNSATAIIVKATISAKKKDGTTISNIDMMRWSGAYYTVDRLKQRIADAYKAKFPDVTVSANNVSFVKNATKDNTYHALYDNYDMSELFGSILWWKNGVTSYSVNIEHFGGLIGVVRNHIYDYVFNGLIGLGVPGNDPNTPEETEQFLACYVRVLNWHVVSNNVTLE